MDQHLDFEQPIYTCLEKIEQLKKIVPAPENLANEIASLERQSQKETEKIYANLSPWQKVLVARHPNRPHTLDYIAHVFDGFEEIDSGALLPFSFSGCGSSVGNAPIRVESAEVIDANEVK